MFPSVFVFVCVPLYFHHAPPWQDERELQQKSFVLRVDALHCNIAACTVRCSGLCFNPSGVHINSRIIQCSSELHGQTWCLHGGCWPWPTSDLTQGFHLLGGEGLGFSLCSDGSKKRDCIVLSPYFLFMLLVCKSRLMTFHMTIFLSMSPPLLYVRHSSATGSVRLYVLCWFDHVQREWLTWMV